MDLFVVVDQVIELLRSRGRVSYRVLKLQLQLDVDAIETLKDELVYAQHVAVDEDGRVLVWTGGPGATPAPAPTPSQSGPSGRQANLPADVMPRPAEARVPEAERRQLTVLFCDLVDSTVLASQLDPEEWREVVRAYQETCARVIARYEGHIAQYLGDGLLVYFGYPLAHEDDAPRAVRAGLGMVEAMGPLNARLSQEHGVQLDVRLGIHTGQVVVGEIGGGARHEQLALGETPNIAARLQGVASPNSVVISDATFQLLGGFFACQPLGTPLLKGVAQPLEVYRVLYESMARSRLEVVGSTGLTPLVGREQEIGLLRQRWEQVRDGMGQVVLLSGEASIGKSRLVLVLTEQVASEPQAWLTPCQCSPYHQNTALYPMIDLLERVVLQFGREESSDQKRRKLEGFVVQYGLPLAEAVPLFAALLSLPLGADYAPLTLSPEQQMQHTLHAFLTILLRIAAQQPVLFVMEDLHWVDPTTLELLSLLVDQGPTARILALFTCRPDFSPPWTGRAHLTQVTLNRLPRRQAAELTGRVAHRKVLPAEVVEQVVAKTDGVPLFVEELTKMVLESGLLQERAERYELTAPLPPLAIPTTLHDSLMARLDRLAAVKGLAQLGARAVGASLYRGRLECAGHPVLADRWAARGAALGAPGGGWPFHQRNGGAPDPAGYVGTHAPGPAAPCRPRRVAHGRERPGGPGGGTRIYPSPGVMSASGGHAPALCGASGALLVLPQPRVAAESAGAGGATPPPGGTPAGGGATDARALPTGAGLVQSGGPGGGRAAL
jgi:class 3 adenylate cyclase